MEFYLKILATVVVASLGWIISHHFTSKRDAKNAQRQRRVDALAEAYDVLIRLGLDQGIPARRNHKGDVVEYSREFEKSVVMIHLYGNKKEIDLVNEVSRQLADENYYNATDLVNELRRDIRQDLGIENYDVIPHYSKNVVVDKWLNKSSQQDASKAVASS